MTGATINENVGNDLESRIRAARILVVDDNIDQLDLMEIMLRRQGYGNVALTDDPTSVAASYAAHPHDLILLDMEMPVIVLTAHEGVDVRLQALQEGARDYISKPVVETEFAHRIHNHLEVRMLYREREMQNEILEQKVTERTQELK